MVENNALPLRTLADYGTQIRRLGGGGFGDVVLYCRNQDCRDGGVAYKTGRQYPGDIDAGLLVEGAIMRSIEHPNIVRLIDVIFSNRQPFYGLILPTAQNSLHGFRGRLTRDVFEIVAYQLIRALAYLESKDITHRDIKPANILVYEERCTTNQPAVPNRITAKIADFGLALYGLCAHNPNVGVAGTPLYTAPEVLVGGPTTPRSDVWSMGLVLYEVLTSTTAFRNNDWHGALLEIVEDFGFPPPQAWPGLDTFRRWQARFSTGNPRHTIINNIRHSNATAEMKDLIIRMLTVNPTIRPNAITLMNHPALANARITVEGCTPYRQVTNCICDVQMIELSTNRHRARRWMNRKRKFVLGEWLEDIRIGTNGSLRIQFLAEELFDEYYDHRSTNDMNQPIMMIEAAYHVASKLLPVYNERNLDFINIVIDANVRPAVAELSLDILRRLNFKIARTTAYDIVRAFKTAYNNATLALAETLLRISSRGTLRYHQTADVVAMTVIALACTATGEAFQHQDRITPNQITANLRYLFSGLPYILSEQASANRFTNNGVPLRTQLNRMPEVRAYVAQLGI